MLRPALVGLTGLITASCGGVENDGRRFESMARMVAAIPVDEAGSPVEMSLRPALVSAEAIAHPADLRVEVMDPHDLWDARDAGLRGVLEAVRPIVADDTAPFLAQAAVRRVAVQAAELRSDAPQTPEARTTLQLGAFASPAAARDAWDRIASAGHAMGDLSPEFETVRVDDRTLTRLKVVASTDAAHVICRAADAVQLGCLRRS